LHVVPVGLKDIIDTFDMPTEYNSPIYAGHRPVIDAACAALLRNAGGIILGKTVTTEFANRFPGPTHHPLAPSHTPGGSSSGSAAAVADGQVPLSLGTQTSGSLIRPAAYCGVVGYKPTFNSISRVGVKQQSGSLDTIGLMARTLEDIVLLRAALLAEPYRGLNASAAPRLGLCRTPQWGEADAATQALVLDVFRRCEAAGARVREVVLPDDLFGGNVDVHRRLANWEGARNFAHEKHTHPELISAALLEGRIRDGERIPFEDYVAAQRQAEAMRAWTETMFEEVDCLITPAAPGEAPEGLAHTGAATFNALWTMLYGPCLTLPAGGGPAGLPLGVQVVGPRYADEALLSAAVWIRSCL
jgi:Asp-tRNA(Asn)/Glu-tRNA(Gln) amidotransferase A subunit family amidase